jgi:hypothetical protein
LREPNPEELHPWCWQRRHALHGVGSEGPGGAGGGSDRVESRERLAADAGGVDLAAAGGGDDGSWWWRRLVASAALEEAWWRWPWRRSWWQ